MRAGIFRRWIINICNGSFWLLCGEQTSRIDVDAGKNFGGYQNTIQMRANGGMEQVIFEDGKDGQIITNVELFILMWFILNN